MSRVSLFVRGASKSLRRNSRLLFGQGLARIVGPRTPSAQLARDQIATVLVVRINGRMGNTLFLTPLLERLHELLPNASIDLALSFPKAGELLRNYPGLRRIIQFPHKGPGLVPRYFKALREMRAERYDLVIDPVPESTSGRVALSLSRARYRLGFATGSQWAPLTHTVPQAVGFMHQAVQPVFLLSRALDAPFDARSLQLSLALTAEEIQSGRAAVARAMTPEGQPPAVPGTTAFGFFAHGTGDKTLGRAWWLAFWKCFLELQPEAVPVEFLPGPQSAPTDVRFPSLHFPSPRKLTAAIAATRMFVSADTGPMHLASSTATPTVALFKTTNPVLYGPLKPTDLVINVGECTPQVAAQQCQRLWQESERLVEIRDHADFDTRARHNVR